MHETATSLAGLGLFLTGLHLLAASMQPLAGRRIRGMLSKLTNGYLASALVGSLLGVITQSSSGAAYVCIGLVNSGTLGFRRALTILAWSSVGTSLLVFLVAIDIRLAGLYLVGLVGVAYLLKADRHKNAKHALAILYALGVLFLGLGMLKETGHLLNNSAWVNALVGFSSEFVIFGFLVGVLLTLVAQSSSVVTIVIIALSVAGVISLHTAVIIVLGANIGSGLSVLLVSSHMKGIHKQLAAYQCLVKLFGVLLFVPCLIIGGEWFAPSLGHTLGKIEVAARISLVYLLLQVFGALAATSMNAKMEAVLARLFPIPHEEALSKPQFIYEEALEDPETALILARKEQDRLLGGLADYLDVLRAHYEQLGDVIPLETRHTASRELAGQLKTFIAEIIPHDNSHASISQVFVLQSRNETILSLQESLYSFVTTLDKTPHDENGPAFSLIEGLHLILILLKDAVAEDGDFKQLLAITFDRSTMMDSIRASLTLEQISDMWERQSLFICTGIFERIVWLVRQVASTDRKSLSDV